MRKTVLTLFAALWACDAGAALFSVTGRQVTIETDRYRVVLDGLAITQLENRLTGEVYAAEPADAGQPSGALRQLLGDQGVAIESLRPAAPVKRYRLGDRTQVRTQRGRGGATITYTGLESGSGDSVEVDERLTVTLRMQIDRATGDLVITPDVQDSLEEVHGFRDRGVLRSAIQVLNLAAPLKVILPVSEGHAFTATPDSKAFTDRVARWAWPQHWEAALAIVEGERGCLGLWADEPELEYGRHVSLARNGGLWNLGFEFETTDKIYRCDEIRGASWRLNVFEGYWVHAARRYVDQMKRQWAMKPLAERAPGWAAKARIVLGSSIPSLQSAEEFAKLVPEDSLLVFTSQGWMKGWNTGEMKFRDWFPNWPWDNPVRYEGVDGLDQQFRALEDRHIHVFPYTNATCLDGEHPWFKNQLHGQPFLAWRSWQRFYPELCRDIVNRYGVSAIYEDCSWVVARHSQGNPDGDNWAQGSVGMREYFHQILPDIAIMGERNNEVTARGQQFALGWITDAGATRHPICGYLFNPFIGMWNLGQNAKSYDDDDLRGFLLTKWPESFNPDPLQEDLMIRKRGLVFAREQLVSYWPETWDPAVLHYFKGRDGAEYRFVRDRGTRFVKVRADGGRNTIYWRLRGVTEASAPGVGIEGWLAYRDDQIIGLNPNVPLYVTVEGVTRPPAVISALPEGWAIPRAVIRDGYWLVALDALDRLKTMPAPEAPFAEVERSRQTLRVRSRQPVKFIGVESAQSVGEEEYEVEVALPGGLGVAWGAPLAPQLPQPLGALPARWSVHDRLSGVVYRRGDLAANPGGFRPPAGEPPNQEGTVTWLLTLPAEPAQLAFQYGTDHGYGDGANYMVRVNGRELWKAYRRQTSADPEEARAHKAPPLESGEVDLSAYAGQTIILELAVNGHHSGVSETVGWQAPRLLRKSSP